MTTMLEVDEDVVAQLDALSSRMGKDKASVLQVLIENANEDLDDAARADEIWERLLRGEEKTFTSEEMRASLGLED